MNGRTLSKKLGKPVSSFLVVDGFHIDEHFYYTTELSRILLVGEPRLFQTIRNIPLIYSIVRILLLLVNNRFLDNRFEKFIEKGEKYLLFQLQEAVKDAIVLTPYNTNAYSVSVLLNYLSEALQRKIGYIKDQIKHDFKWDRKSFNSLKKSGAWALGSAAFMVGTDLEVFHLIGLLGLLLGLYQVLKNSYKVLTVKPNASSESLDKYEKLLLFVQQLKVEFKANKLITFTLPSGHLATIQNGWLDTVIFS